MDEDDSRLERAARLMERAQVMQEQANELRAEAFALMAEISGRKRRDDRDLLEGDGHSP